MNLQVYQFIIEERFEEVRGFFKTYQTKNLVSFSYTKINVTCNLNVCVEFVHTI